MTQSVAKGITGFSFPPKSIQYNQTLTSSQTKIIILSMWLLDKIHAVLDAGLHYLKLIEDRQVGWLTLDRKSGDFKREQQSLWKKLKLLLLFNPVTEWIDQTHALRLWTHKKNISAGKCTEPTQRLLFIIYVGRC
jgi:hypothetical protein